MLKICKRCFDNLERKLGNKHKHQKLLEVLAQQLLHRLHQVYQELYIVWVNQEIGSIQLLNQLVKEHQVLVKQALFNLQ